MEAQKSSSIKAKTSFLLSFETESLKNNSPPSVARNLTPHLKRSTEHSECKLIPAAWKPHLYLW